MTEKSDVVSTPDKPLPPPMAQQVVWDPFSRQITKNLHKPLTATASVRIKRYWY